MSATATPPNGRSSRLPSSKPARRARTRSGRPGVVRLGLGVLSALWLLLRVAVIVTCLGIIVAWRGFDVTPMAIVSGSMEPTIATNSLIFVEAVKPSAIRSGDIITFDPPGDTPRVTHRVVEREKIGGEWYFTTKGDANESRDDWRTPAAIESGQQTQGVSYQERDALRHVWGVPYLGHIVKLTEHTMLRMVLVFGSLAAIMLLLLARIWRSDDGASAAAAATTDETTRGGRARKVTAR